MKAAQRHLRIRELLDQQEFVDLSTLCRELGSSVATVRRDLAALEARRALRRVHGGALTTDPRDHVLDHEWQSHSHGPEKARIGRAAARLIGDRETAILDGGSTVACVAREMVDRSGHVITNSLAIAYLLRNARDIEVTLTGGYLFPRLEVMLGPLCEQMLARVAADVLVMGTGGVTEAGFSNNNTLVVGSERKMIEVSRKVIVVVDSSKFGRAAMTPLAALDVADAVVTDTALTREHRRMLEAHDIEVVLA